MIVDFNDEMSIAVEKMDVTEEDRKDKEEEIPSVSSSQTSSSIIGVTTVASSESCSSSQQQEPELTSSTEASNVHSHSMNFEVAENIFEVDDTNAGEGLPSPKEVKYTTEETSSLLEQDGDTRGSNQVVCFVNKDAKVTPSPVLQYILDIEQPFDTVICCADGKIGCHRLVLAAASVFIGDMFQGHDHRLGEVAVVVLPDVRVSIMKTLLNFCYTGSMVFPEEDKNEVFETMRFLLLGELGNLSLKQVVVKQPDPIPSSSNNSNMEIESEQQSNSVPDCENAIISSDLNLGEVTFDVEDNEQLEQISSSSDEDKDSDGESDCSDVGSSVASGSKPKSLSHIKRFEGCSTNSEYNFLVLPRAPGSKFRFFQCCKCPGTFKTVETLSTHMENNHEIFLQSREVDKTELESLLFCDICKVKYNQISSATGCLGKHHHTRCLICLELIRTKNFDHHMKKTHLKKLRNGTHVVKCRWCDAGLLSDESIDNKAISGHCYAHHFGGRGHKFDTSVLSNVKMEACQPTPPSESRAESLAPVVFPLTPVQPSVSKTKSTPTPSKIKPVPAILQMLQKASQKRKFTQLQATEEVTKVKPEKRIRRDENGRPLQVAKRTGKPIGRQVILDTLKKGVPDLRAQSRGKYSTIQSVTLDVTNLPSIYVHFMYDKTFILDHLNKLNKGSSSIDDKTREAPEIKMSVSSIPKSQVTVASASKSVDLFPRCAIHCY